MSIIIYLPSLDWTWMKQRPQHLMSELARLGHTVYYCNRTQSDRPVEEVEHGLFVVHQHEEWIREGLPALKMREHADVGVWCTLPMQAGFIKQEVDPDWVIYDCVDEVPQWLAYEQQIVSISNAIVCTSERLYRRLNLTYPEQSIHLIRNAYDVTMKVHFEVTNPQPVQQIPLQIGFIGAWAPWVDEGLLLKLADVLKNTEIIIIGPEFERKYSGALQRRSNIHFLGLRRHDELADLMRRLTVAIIPFHLTPIALAANPVKAYEYLAAGIPVITTNLPECRRMAPHVDVAATQDSFIQLVKHRLQEPGDAVARQQYALANTWQHRGEQVAELLATLQIKQEAQPKC
ncbi:glycosyltransferase [Paenibacillus sp. N1-5-1-14]|uniref:glycosyltransferase n=1 Tax=Paenibacillus radicibacter TaxID=2972488 RepID=UPI0021592EE6|nr:glycosyltransferase [Paenibacillus radicibacter]MCR8644689.1 glycosyltransferase [Paenibacillus radicibacter]